MLAWWLVHDHPGRANLPTMRETDGKVAHPPHQGHWYGGLLLVLRNRDTWPGLFVNLGIGGTFFTFAGLWAVPLPLLRDGYGLDRAAATAHTSLMLTGFAVGAFFIGTLSDRLGRRKPVVFVAGGLYALCWLVLANGCSLPAGPSHALFLVVGLGSSAFTMTWACAKEVNRHALSGMATGVANMGAFLGTAILQPLFGWVIDYSSGGGNLVAASYAPGVWVLTAFALMGLASAFGQRETFCRYLDSEPDCPPRNPEQQSRAISAATKRSRPHARRAVTSTAQRNGDRRCACLDRNRTDGHDAAALRNQDRWRNSPPPAPCS